MTLYKQFIIIVVLLLCLNINVNAQSTVLRPYEGSIHTYAWNGLQEGAEYQFYIALNSDFRSTRLDDIATGEFDFIGETSGTIGAGGSTASTQIGWNTGASLHVYYVWLQVTGTNGCSNYRYVEVVPQVNDFDMLSQNVPVTNTRSCPELETDNGHNPSSTAYNAGSTQLLFRVVRENGTDNRLTAAAGDTYDWSFVPVLNVDPEALALGRIVISIVGTNSGVITPVAGRYSVSGLDDEVLVTVSIQNAPGYTLDVRFGVSEQREDNTNLSDGDPSNDTITHTIEVIPVIGGMGGV